MASILQKYLTAIKQENIRTLTKKSRDWFVDMLVSGGLRGSAQKLMKDEMVKTRSRPMIGKMYMFVYDPKLKKKLPYYDRYPLIIMADTPAKGQGFYGLNLHYLRPIDRAKFLAALEQAYSSTSDLKDTTKLRISYGILKRASKHRMFRPTFKRYLPKHIRSNIVEIPAPYWEIALFLPTQRFVKANANTVWADSKKRYTR